VTPGAAGAPTWARRAAELLALSPHIADLSPEQQAALGEIPAEDMSELARIRLDSLVHLGCGGDSPRQRLYDAVWKRQRAALLETVEALASASVRSLIFKGAEHLERWYDSRSLSFLGDVDLLVDRPDIVEVQRVLFGLGYRPGGYVPGEGWADRDIADVGKIEAEHYQLPPFAKTVDFELDDELLAELPEDGQRPVFRAGERTLLLLELDVHHGVATDVEPEQFFERAVPSTFGVGSTFCAADHVWVTLSRLYVEVALHDKRVLRDFAYLVPLIAGSEVEWPVVVQVAESMELRPHLFYFLSFVDLLAEGSVPADVLAALDPALGVRDHDWGWQLGKLLGTSEPSPLRALGIDAESRAADPALRSSLAPVEP
jgi:hypothetical protein